MSRQSSATPNAANATGLAAMTIGGNCSLPAKPTVPERSYSLNPMTAAASPASPARTPPTKPELLAPAGDWEAMRAAVANGADAVYFGLDNFNARHRATNFRQDELPEIMAYLHGHNVKGF